MTNKRTKKKTRTPTFEEVTLDELSARYMRINEAQREEGYGGISAENHFQLALLYLNTNRFSVVNGSHGALYRIPKWSDFAEKHIITMEAESSKNPKPNAR